jgi:hypothetical protein
VGDAGVGLFGPTQVGLGYEDVTHGEHTQTAQLFRGVEHHRGEPV